MDDAAGISEGPRFRPVTRHGHVQSARVSDRGAALAVKRAAARAGLDPARYSGHSFRTAPLPWSGCKCFRRDRRQRQHHI